LFQEAQQRELHGDHTKIEKNVVAKVQIFQEKEYTQKQKFQVF
jgi:hypothetical protein